jgi:hypothetical protein
MTMRFNNQLARLTLHQAIPAIYQQRAFPGGLVSYGESYAEGFSAGGYLRWKNT